MFSGATSKITIVNSVSPSINPKENIFLERLAEIEQKYELEDHQQQESGILAGKAFMSTFSDLFQTTDYRQKSGNMPQFDPSKELKMDPVLKELENEGLDSEPLELILSGIANHVNSCIGRILEKQKELEADAIALEQEILHLISPKINARYQSLKLIAEQSKHLNDIALIAKNTREEFDKNIASILAVQSKLPSHLKLAESEKMLRKYPLLSQYIKDHLVPSPTSFTKNKA